MKSFLCGSEKVAANLLVLAWPNSKFTAQKLKYNNKTIFCVILLLSYIFQQKKQLTAILLCWTWNDARYILSLISSMFFNDTQFH